jgi:hypothetical protein
VRLTPIVVLVDDDTLAKLTPLVTELAERLQPDGGQWWGGKHGWTPEAVAWGLLIAAASKCDLELSP